MDEFNQLFSELRSAVHQHGYAKINQIEGQLRELDIERYYDQAHLYLVSFFRGESSVSYATQKRLSAIRVWAQQLFKADCFDIAVNVLEHLSTSGNISVLSSLLVQESTVQMDAQQHQSIETLQALHDQARRLLKFDGSFSGQGSVSLDARDSHLARS